MNSFDACREIENESLRIILPMLEQKAYGRRFTVFTKERLSPFLQRTVGDFSMNTGPDHEFITGEIKSERRHTGNLFLETWSNRSREREGWMRTLDADLLLYHFLDRDVLYVVNFQALRSWFLCNESKYDERCQSKWKQLNDTWGRIVPVADIRRNLPVKVYRPIEEFGPNTWSRRAQQLALFSGVSL